MEALILLSEWQKSQIEFWRKIEGFEGYDVSNFGRVRTWIKNVKGKPIRNGKLFASVPKIMLTSHTDSSGYPYASIWGDDGKRRCPKVHRLVANAFIPNLDGLPEVNHLTGLKSDNRVDGLEHITRLGNIRHAIAVGLKHPHRVYGDARPHSRLRLSDSEVRDMQRLYWEENVKPSRLAEMFKTTYGNAQDIAYGSRGRGKRFLAASPYAVKSRRPCGQPRKHKEKTSGSFSRTSF